jgi:hypothetical protein
VITALIAGLLACVWAGTGHAVAVDSLTLQAPEGLRVWREYNRISRSFTTYMTWNDVADSVGTYIHPPDTTGWVLVHDVSEMSVPSVSGNYSGDIDRTINFRALDAGQVGIDAPIDIYVEIVREENYNVIIDVGAPYVPGTPIPLIFNDSRNLGQTIDLGIQIAFSAGFVDIQGIFSVGVEDFEGYHVWRGIEPDGSDLTVIGELSKQEAYRGQDTGGSLADSIYFYSVIPELREVGTWFSPLGAVDCLGRRIDLQLADNEMMWFDCNTFNGFTYYYAVTTFDRGYLVRSGRQGLNKVDNCEVTNGLPFECRDELVPLTVEVDAQNDVQRIYAVPNPYRSGGSRLTQENYHNFPDDKVRFVNVPPRATIRVYTVAGDLVWEGEHDGNDGNIEWNVENGNSEPVASGVYIFKVEAGNGDTVYGRLVVIR